MAKNYLVFQRFYDQSLANEVVEILKQHHIDYTLEDTKNNLANAFTKTYATEPEMILKLNSDDFSKANIALENYYQSQLENVDKDYYLFDFSDEQLMEVITKPDEWGSLNYQLAKHILKEKGKNINFETLNTLKQERIDELSKPKKVDKATTVVGYILPFVGIIFLICAIISTLIGCNLLYNRKTLPNGNKIFIYSNADRKNGKIIILLSILCIIIYLVRRYMLY